MIQGIVHYSLHFLAPGLIAFIFFRNKWKYAWLVMLGTMLIDLDHLLVTPVFDPNRCSIGFHPLHSSFAILFYIMLLFPKRPRLVALGLVFHIVSDYIDCLMMA